MINEDFYGDRFRWFVGVVKETTSDNRVRVRVFGVHRMDDTTNVSDGDLPLATILYPTTGSQGTSGSISHGLKSGTWVFGFFVDGEDSQQPVILGVIPGSTYGSYSGSSTGAVTPGAPGTAAAYDGVNTGETINIPGGSNIEKAYNFLRAAIEKAGQSGGSVHAQVSGIIGNLIEESNVNPNGPRGDSGTAYGIAQWRGSRREKLARLYGEPSNLEQQLSFIWQELQDTEKKAYNKLMAASTVEEATEAFCYFERPRCFKGNYIDKSDSTWPGRLKNAYKVYNSIKYTPPTS